MICAVIPTCNSEDGLPGLLMQLRGGAARCVITDSRSTDGTLRLAVENAAVIALGSPGRGTQLGRGVSWSGNCEWLLILHSDSKLPENWSKLVQDHIRKYPGKAGYFDLRFDNTSFAARLVEFLVRLRSGVLGLPYGDQGLLISKVLYEGVGGYPNIPLFEDVAIIRALGKARIRRLGGPLLTCAKKYESGGFYKRGWRNLGLLRRYLCGENPADIAQEYI